MITVNHLLDEGEREVVEFMYLLLTRCLNNISVINDKIAKYGKKSHLLEKLQNNVHNIYNMVTKEW